MDRAGKQIARKELEDIFETAGAVIVTHYSGMSVAELTDLRTRLRDSGARFKVIKNRIAKVALDGKGGDAVADLFKGPVGIAYGEDPTVPAKVTSEYAKTNEKLRLVGAVMDGAALDASGVKALADLPSREELIATVLARLLGQASQITQRLNAPGQQLAGAIEAIREKASA